MSKRSLLDRLKNFENEDFTAFSEELVDLEKRSEMVTGSNAVYEQQIAEASAELEEKTKRVEEALMNARMLQHVLLKLS